MDKNTSRADMLNAGRKKLQQFRQTKDKGSTSRGKKSKKSGKTDQREVDNAASTTVTSQPPLEFPKAELTPHVESVDRLSDSSLDNAASTTVTSQPPLEFPQAEHTPHVESADRLSDSTLDNAASTTVTSQPPLEFPKVELTPHVESADILSDSSLGNAASTTVTSHPPLVFPKAELTPHTEFVDRLSDSSLSRATSNSVNIDQLTVPSTVDAGIDGTLSVYADGKRLQESCVGEHDVNFPVQTKLESSHNIDDDTEIIISSGTYDSSNLEETTSRDNISKRLEECPQNVLIDTNEKEKHLFPSREDVSDILLIQGAGDQVSYVGTMQEAYSLGIKHSDRRSGINSEEEEGHISSELHANAHILAESASGMSVIENIMPEVEQIGETDLSAVREVEINYEALNRHTEETVTGLPNDENLNVNIQPGESDHSGNDMLQTGMEDMTVAEVSYGGHLPEGHSRGEEKMVSSSGEWPKSSFEDVRSASFSQLVEVIKRLSEDEYQFLLNSKGTVSSMMLGTDSPIECQYGLSDMLARLKEELFITNFSKDIFHLQLTEQLELQLQLDQKCNQFVDEISMLNASLSDFSGRNESLVEELARCNSNLDAVSSGKKVLEDQLHNAKAEAEEFSARASELQINLEKSQGDLLSRSRELSDCKDLVADLQVENKTLDRRVVSLTDEGKKFEEEKDVYLHENEKLLLELSEYKTLVASLQVENFNLSENLALVREGGKKIGEENEYVTHENEKLQMQLVECNALMSVLQVENANIKGNLALVVEEKDNIVHENCMLSDQLLVLKDQLSRKHSEWVQLDDELKGVTMRLEQLAKENAVLNSSLDFPNTTMRKIDDSKIQMLSETGETKFEVQDLEVQTRDHVYISNEEDPFQNSRNGDAAVSSSAPQKSSYDDGLAGGSPFELFDPKVIDDSYGFVVLKGHLDDAEQILQKLEKGIEGMHSHSVSVIRSGGKPDVPAVSKLIQAFELKVHVDEHDVAERPVTEEKSPEDLFTLTKEQTRNLRNVLKQLGLGAENVGAVVKREEECRIKADDMVRDLKGKYEALEEHTNNLEATTVEVGVLYEAVKQHAFNVGAENCELKVIHQSLKQQTVDLNAENVELKKKLAGYLSSYTELENKLCEFQRSSDEMVSKICTQLESLQNEAAERASEFVQHWSSTSANIVEVIQKLDDSIGRVSDVYHDGLNIDNHVADSVDAAIKMIKDLHQKIEFIYGDHEAISILYKEVEKKLKDMCEKNDLSTGVLQKMIVDLGNLILHSCGSEEENLMNIQMEKLLDPTGFDALVLKLRDLVEERLQLIAVNNSLREELITKVKYIEELNRTCLDSEPINKLIEGVEGVIKLEDAEDDLDKPLSSQVESLVSFLVRKYKDAEEIVRISREECELKVMELTELQEKMHHLSFQNVEHQNEILNLRESLSHAQEALGSVRSEFQEKASELEQSEQRVSSLREKLSIAVAKGKGLVVQRDSLKKSLAETSNELERCSQELQSKDARIHELETKLKTYSEAGERVDALESELSYIRNSATSLRESFLLKDSVLQRIEEIIEDLDLPENFHSRDVIEKVSWLARSATGNFSRLTDWDQKSSGEGGSYSDAGFAVMDSWKEDANLSSNSGDDLRRKFEELQNKFFGLAEQNEMLEQSLMERNNVIQRWEELLDRIDMPLHLRSVEPEDRIEWLSTALSEALHDRNSFLQKVDTLESYCDTVLSELEESRSRKSNLEVDLQSVLNERDSLSERLDKLIRDYEKLSAKGSELELENQMLRNEATVLQEKLAENLGNEERLYGIEGDIRKLQDLVRDGLQDTCTEDLFSGGSGMECLEDLIMKLLASHDINSFQQKVDTLEKYCNTVSSELEDSRSRISELEGDLRSVLNERDSLSERLDNLFRDYEKISAKETELELANQMLFNEGTVLQEKLAEKLGNEERLCDIEDEIKKLQDLVRDGLQDPCPTKDLSSGGSVTGCLEELIRKLLASHASLYAVKPNLGGEGITRDTQYKDPDVVILKNELEEASHELMRLKEERDGYMEKEQLLICKVEVQDKKMEELQELLSQEEQKSASVREKLNVAVRKGKSLVQQRDSLKQTIEDMQSEAEHLKSEIKRWENVLAEYEQKIRNLSTYPGRVETLELENISLRKHLTENECHLQEKKDTLSMIINTLSDIDAGGEADFTDPVKMLEQIAKLFHDLHSDVASSKHEARKSKRASELLLAELNEVQERNDGLQDELAKASIELKELSKERDLAETAKLEAFSQFEKLSSKCTEERETKVSEFRLLKSDVNQLRKGFLDVNDILADFLSKDLEFLQNLEAGMELCKPNHATFVIDVPSFSESGNTDNFSADSWLDSKWQDQSDENLVNDVSSFVRHHLQSFKTEITSLKDKLKKHSISLYEQANSLSKAVEIVHKEMISQKESSDAMKRDIKHIESIEQEKDKEITVFRRNISFLYEACIGSIMEIDNRKRDLLGNNFGTGDPGISVGTFVDHGLAFREQTSLASEENMKTVADRLLLCVKDFTSMKTDMMESSNKEMKLIIANLQKELQEKDLQKERICMELVNQIKEAEASAASYSRELQHTKSQMHDCSKQLELKEEEWNLLEQRVKELQDEQGNLKEFQERIRVLNDTLAAKDQEINALMQALDEEETQMEGLVNKIEELENVVKQKNSDLENLEASRGKTMKKLSVTVSRFDELHHLSESLLSEVEKLQSQVQDRDTDISFLRQEVTRCTNDVLVASQTNNKRDLDEFNEFLTWVDSIISRVVSHDAEEFDRKKSSEVHEFQEILQQKIAYIISELEDLRLVAQSNDTMLLVERSKVEELTRKGEALEKSLWDNESQLNLLEGPVDSANATGGTTENFEVEPLMNKWTVSGTSAASQVRSLRKVNNDQIAISVDHDPGSSSRLEDEDDDKVHGFKSLTTSRIVPRFTRPVTDMIDGLWVSCDRALMRQPALRLGIILYWFILHALVATYVV